MTQEDKAKAYDEALERAKNLHKDAIDMGETLRAKQCEIIFPELAESEDERIREELIEFVKSRGGFKQEYIAWLEKQCEPTEINPSEFDSQLNRLLKQFQSLPKEELASSLSFYLNVVHNDGTYKEEKQGEHKVSVDEFHAKDWYVSKIDGKIRNIYHSSDKVEPKFKVGDWITDGNITIQIEAIKNNCYLYCGDCALYSTKTADKVYHLWTLQDAKNGDVLVNGSNIFIFHFLNDTRLMGYCHVNTNDGRFYDDIGKNECFCLIDAAVTPATKEQRDLLFQKMKEAGYEWDVENKELKKIEQEDEEYNGEDYGIDSLYHAISILEKTLGEVEGYQSDDGILEHKCAITAVKELYKKKPAEWSEEDEKHIDSLLKRLEGLCRNEFERTRFAINEDQDWLNQLKERIKN